MRDRDSTTRTGAKDPWGREGRPLAQRQADAPAILDSEPDGMWWPKPAKDRCKRRGAPGMSGTDLTGGPRRQALSDRLALKPYWGKPTVRNFREGHGNVGIIRSPVRAITLPDHESRRRRGPFAPKTGFRRPEKRCSGLTSSRQTRGDPLYHCLRLYDDHRRRPTQRLSV